MPRLALLLALFAALPCRADDYDEEPPPPAQAIVLAFDGAMLHYTGPDATIWFASESANCSVAHEGDALVLRWTFSRWPCDLSLSVYQHPDGIDVVGTVAGEDGKPIGEDCCEAYSTWAELLASHDWLAVDVKTCMRASGAELTQCN